MGTSVRAGAARAVPREMAAPVPASLGASFSTLPANLELVCSILFSPFTLISFSRKRLQWKGLLSPTQFRVS